MLTLALSSTFILLRRQAMSSLGPLFGVAQRVGVFPRLALELLARYNNINSAAEQAGRCVNLLVANALEPDLLIFDSKGATSCVPGFTCTKANGKAATY